MHYPFFCVAEEAKPLARKFFKYTEGKLHLHLVTSRFPPKEGHEPKVKLNDDEPVDTDFIGASVHECQQWALGIGKPLKYNNSYLVFIADARSADDDTILIQHYSWDDQPAVYVLYGPQPAKSFTWYEWRVPYQKGFDAAAQLAFGDISNVNQIYYGLKGELVDEHGVFDVTGANALVAGKDRSKLGSIIDWTQVVPNL